MAVIAWARRLVTSHSQPTRPRCPPRLLSQIESFSLCAENRDHKELAQRSEARINTRSKGTGGVEGAGAAPDRRPRATAGR
ncbi:hypothetical protein JYU34_003948, partial [Plutella xylostella]